MQKYTRIPEQLLAEGCLSAANFFAPKKLSSAEIVTTHTPLYWQQLRTQTLPAKAARAIGLPMSAALVQRSRHIAYATYACALHAKQHGVSLNVAGGTHHAFADHGEGFCVLNDVCIASHLLLARQQAKQILVVDLDVHQGNGTASIMAKQPQVFTFSMHGASNYPFVKQRSDLDIELADGCDDDTYLWRLITTLPALLDRVRPDMIFYQAAVDVLASDKLGKLALTQDGCRMRDHFVFAQAKARGIPVAVVMGGGYSAQLDDVVEAHCNTFRLAKTLYA